LAYAFHRLSLMLVVAASVIAPMGREAFAERFFR